jgi:hypothetical protein
MSSHHSMRPFIGSRWGATPLKIALRWPETGVRQLFHHSDSRLALEWNRRAVANSP